MGWRRPHGGSACSGRRPRSSRHSSAEPAAPYDRIIATCAVDRIPAAWIAQTRPGGVILANLRGNLMRGAQVRLVVADEHTARGPFVPGYGSFMALRHDAAAPFDYSVTVDKDTSPPTAGVTDLDDPGSLESDLSWAFVAQLALPDAVTYAAAGPDGADGTELVTADHSWAHITQAQDRTGRHRTHQAGSRWLWDLLEAAHQRWYDLGRPSWDRFGLTVAHGRHHIWFDNPTGSVPWP